MEVHFELGVETSRENKVKRHIVVGISALLFLAPCGALPQQSSVKPGLASYTPTRIEWLAVVINSQVRRDMSGDNSFMLSVVNSDHETLLIFVRYLPTVNREVMNMAIDNTREVIMITARGYGWDKWVKVKERVEMATLKSR